MCNFKKFEKATELKEWVLQPLIGMASTKTAEITPDAKGDMKEDLGRNKGIFYFKLQYIKRD